ncbi:MAG: hypothetical protein ACXWMY_19110 [Vulcanimicrobiaceae bacterium]
MTDPGMQTLKGSPPSSPDEIRRMAAQAGLRLPEAIMDELCKSYPAFEAMVRRLPRARARFDEPAHHCTPIERIAALERS